MITGKNIFSNLSLGQQYLLNDIKKFRQKWLVKKSKFVWRKKNPPRAQIFRYFRIESRNNKLLHTVVRLAQESLLIWLITWDLQSAHKIVCSTLAFNQFSINNFSTNLWLKNYKLLQKNYLFLLPTNKGKGGKEDVGLKG